MEIGAKKLEALCFIGIIAFIYLMLSVECAATSSGSCLVANGDLGTKFLNILQPIYNFIHH